MSENMGASTSRNPKGLHGLYRDNFTFYIIFKSRADNMFLLIFHHPEIMRQTGQQTYYQNLDA
jgi:hypothetical protein